MDKIHSELIPDYLDVIRIPFVIPTPRANLERWVLAFVIYGETLTVIDTGVAGAEHSILDRITERGRGPREVTLALLTHAHPDHVGGAHGLRAATGCRIGIHHAEVNWVEDVSLQARARPVPGFDGLVGGSVPVERALQDGDRLDFEGRTLHIIHTPGHSAGSASFLLEPDGLLFSGDAVPVPGEMPIYDDPKLLLNSLDRLRRTDFRVLFQAWASPCSAADAHRQIDSSIAWVKQIEAAVQRSACTGVSEPAVLTREVLATLGLSSSFAANPLVTRTLMAHLK